MSKLSVFQELKDTVLSCTKCDLGCSKPSSYDPHVMGEGNLDADIMFVAEAPGKQETINKQPLTYTGTSGKKFEKVLAHLELQRSDVYVTNVILCKPEGNADPLLYQVMACKPYFEKQIDLVSPKLIVTFGRFAGEAVMGYCKITRDRGKLHESKFALPVFPMYHPAYVSAYANPQRRREFSKDVNTLKKIVNSIRLNGCISVT